MEWGECYRRIKPVDIRPLLVDLAGLQFLRVGYSPGKYPCDVVLKGHFTPELSAFVDGLGLGGTLARALLRRLSPHQSIPPHVDEWMPDATDWRRFQVPLTSHPDIVMRWPDDGVETHLEPGWLYEVRFDRLHEVVNDTASERVHLQIDQVRAMI